MLSDVAPVKFTEAAVSATRKGFLTNSLTRTTSSAWGERPPKLNLATTSASAARVRSAVLSTTAMLRAFEAVGGKMALGMAAGLPEASWKM